MKGKNFLGHLLQWEWTMKKLNTPLSVSTYAIGAQQGIAAFEYPQCLTATWYDNGDIYFDREEIQIIRQFLCHKISRDPGYPNHIARKVFLLSRRIQQQRIPPQKLQRMSLLQLVAILQKEMRFFVSMISFMSYRGSVQMGEVLADLVDDLLVLRCAERNQLDRKTEYRELLQQPLYPSIVMQEKLYALQLAKGFNTLRNKQQEQRIAQYVHRYRWLSYHWFVGSPPDTTAVRKRLQNFASDAATELQRHKTEMRQNEQRIRNSIKTLRLSAAEQQLVKQSRLWIFLRTFVKDNINHAGYKLLPILGEIGKRVQIPEADMPYLTLDEILNIRCCPPEGLRVRIAERKVHFSAGIIGSEFMIGEFTVMRSQQEKSTTLKGAIAYRGVVRGIAKVLHNPSQQNKLAQDEILVTAMTTPDFLPAMERAAAFVTDEGGITCHAAIVAREMKKPCIIGTKYATKALKDGDMIEVDANAGVVRKL